MIVDIDCDDFLKLLAVAAGTYFWCWYLVFENEQRAKEAQNDKP